MKVIDDCRTSGSGNGVDSCDDDVTGRDFAVGADVVWRLEVDGGWRRAEGGGPGRGRRWRCLGGSRQGLGLADARGVPRVRATTLRSVRRRVPLRSPASPRGRTERPCSLLFRLHQGIQSASSTGFFQVNLGIGVSSTQNSVSSPEEATKLGFILGGSFYVVVYFVVDARLLLLCLI